MRCFITSHGTYTKEPSVSPEMHKKRRDIESLEVLMAVDYTTIQVDNLYNEFCETTTTQFQASITYMYTATQ